MQRTPHTAFVLGAGLGTRLRPLTEDRPKPLVPVCGKPLITFAFDHLLAAGLQRLIINTHHCAEQYAVEFPEARYRGFPLIFRHEPVLLETGGGIRNIADLLDREPLLVYNGDVLTDLPLAKALAAHENSDAEITLVLRGGGGPRHVAFDPATNRVRDIRNLCETGQPSAYLFTGIYVIQPAFIERIPADTKISIIPILVEMLKNNIPVGGALVDEGNWWDLGTLDEHEAMQQRLREGWHPSFPAVYSNEARRKNAEHHLRMHCGDFTLEPLEKGGSDRRFYRLREADKTRIVLNYVPEQKEENTIYLNVARFLKTLGVRVPAILRHDSAACLVLMEDLGERDLWSYRNEPWPERRRLYNLALREAARLHARGVAAYEAAPFPLYPPFDEEMYRWEREYFIDNCLGRHFGLPEKTLHALRNDADLLALARELSALSRCLLQRDFQSQNVMIHEGQAWIIDFQGLRFGVSAYDVASLLYDPYVALTEDERLVLRQDYEKIAVEEGLRLEKNFASLFDRCALHRLMQALGAYGFLGLVKGKPRFLEFIPIALRSLQTVTRRTGAFPKLDSALANLLS